MPLLPFDTYTQGELTPAFFPEVMRKAALPVAANQHLVKGAVVGICQSANVACVQTLTQASASGGTFTISFGFGTVYTTAPLGYLATAAQIQAALQALPNIGSGGVTCTGGALGTAGVVCTFGGTLANQPQPLFVINNGGLTGAGAAVTAAMTTAGVANNSLEAYSGALQAPPTTAPVLTDSAGAGTWLAGNYLGCYTFGNSVGETLPSPVAEYTSAGTKKVHWATIANIPSWVTYVNYYINGQFAVQKAPAAGGVAAFDVDLADVQTVSPVPPPKVGTATVVTDGSQVPVGLIVVEVSTDPSGNVTYGPLPTGNGFGSVKHVAPIAISGYFNTADLTGLDANAVSKLGRLIDGTTTSGVLCLTGG